MILAGDTCGPPPCFESPGARPAPDPAPVFVCQSLASLNDAVRQVPAPAEAP